ncbi:expressed unknown protein [Seminavis robusta]|uniref:Uncharacterized protein n=1 Tax=Seminavis robusta TaxID=568900 RepID=A0A9N8HWZ7_9STRA|nr:expressed unknown protein [Seminavis robusta]|eukprot:Sro2091_g313990.1 n/a (271) ;mRNA; f:1504-2316
MQLGYGGTLPAKTTVTATEELGYGDMKLDNSKAPNQVSSLEYEDASPSSTNGMPLTTNAHNKVFDPASYYATRRRNSMSTGGCRNSGISGLARVHRGGGRRASMEHTSSTTSPTTEPQQPTRSAVSFKMRRRSTSSKEETQDRGTYSITSFIKMESGVGVDDSSHSIDGSMARRGIRRSMSCDESDRHRLSRMHSNMSADSSAARRDFCANNNSTERTTGTTKNKQDTAAFLGSRIIRLDSSNPGRRGSLLKGHMKQKANVNLIKSCLLS